MLVYVLNIKGQPLMPTTERNARLLLENNLAKVVRRVPFTIKLLYLTTSYTQPLTLGIDTGSSKIGSAVSKDSGDIVYLSEIQIRNDISGKMKQRAKYRRSRRTRKTRYRMARWLNRRSSIRKDRFSPTMTSKINSHLKEIKFVKSILPITSVILETASFDVHALKNPEVLTDKWLYQHGVNYGFANTKAYVLDRDSYICQYCRNKTKGIKLEVHHIIFRENGGSDDCKNLITLCKTCHDSLHKGDITIKGGKTKGQLKHATQMNSIRTQLLKLLPEARETFGYITKLHRQLWNLPKEHYIDAAVIASFGNIVNFKINTVLFKKCVSDGDYQQTKGVRSQQNIPTGKIQGFRKFDKVRYMGSAYFIKGRMNTGYAILMDINSSKIDFSNLAKGMKTPKLANMTKLGSRKSWIM
jgi:hypothetical protein